MAELQGKIPKLEKENAQTTIDEVAKMVKDGTINKWLDSQLGILSNTNPVLYKLIVDRSQKFASGAVLARDPTSIAVSMVLEQVLMLVVLEEAVANNEDLKEFSFRFSQMVHGDSDWLKILDKKMKALDKK